LATYRVFGEKISETLGQTEFLQAVGQLRFRGTSHLLRSPKSVLTYLQERRGYTLPSVDTQKQGSQTELEKLSQTLIQEMGKSRLCVVIFLILTLNALTSTLLTIKGGFPKSNVKVGGIHTMLQLIVSE
jgi:hypothetical protein